MSFSANRVSSDVTGAEPTLLQLVDEDREQQKKALEEA